MPDFGIKFMFLEEEKIGGDIFRNMIIYINMPCNIHV